LHEARATDTSDISGGIIYGKLMTSSDRM
jgi:hypothetical protein